MRKLASAGPVASSSGGGCGGLLIVCGLPTPPLMLKTEPDIKLSVPGVLRNTIHQSRSPPTVMKYIYKIVIAGTSEN